MLKQTLFCSKPTRMSTKDRQLVIRNEEGKLIATRPIEDIPAQT